MLLEEHQCAPAFRPTQTLCDRCAGSQFYETWGVLVQSLNNVSLQNLTANSIQLIQIKNTLENTSALKIERGKEKTCSSANEQILQLTIQNGNVYSYKIVAYTKYSTYTTFQQITEVHAKNNYMNMFKRTQILQLTVFTDM